MDCIETDFVVVAHALFKVILFASFYIAAPKPFIEVSVITKQKEKSHVQEIK